MSKRRNHVCMSMLKLKIELALIKVDLWALMERKMYRCQWICPKYCIIYITVFSNVYPPRRHAKVCNSPIVKFLLTPSDQTGIVHVISSNNPIGLNER